MFKVDPVTIITGLHHNVDKKTLDYDRRFTKVKNRIFSGGINGDTGIDDGQVQFPAQQ